MHSFTKFYIAHCLSMLGKKPVIEFSFIKGEERYDVFDFVDGIAYEVETSGRTEHKEVYKKNVQIKDVIVIRPKRTYYGCMEAVNKKLGVELK